MLGVIATGITDYPERFNQGISGNIFYKSLYLSILLVKILIFMHEFTKYVLTAALFIFFSTICFSQNISGIWEGNYGRNLLTPQPRKLVVEINIYNDSLISGLSHLYYRNGKYEHYVINGVFHKADSTIIFREDSIIAVNLGPLSSPCLGKYTTRLKITDSSMRQEGKWKDKNFLGCPTTTVWLEKKLPRPRKKELLPDSIEIKTSIPDIPVKVLERETDIQKLVEVAIADKDSIKIELYDNGEVDGDSVSLYINDKEIINRQRISTDPIIFYLSLDKNNPLSKLKLVAESLGTIPPCTAVMIITTKHLRQQVSLSSNFDKNATVEFFLKE